MKVSIITACFNSVETIETAIRSVMSQQYGEIEYIVVDGGSDDGTLDVIGKYREHIQTLVSGRDGGIYDALNKGLGLATGEIVAFLHSDDCYADSRAIRCVVDAFMHKKTDCVYGDLQYVKRDDISVVVRKWTAGEYRHGMFLQGWMPPHPTFFSRLSCYREYGGYDTSFRCSGDYELMLRFLHLRRLSVTYVPTVLVNMRSGGMSNATLTSRIRANREDRRAWAVNGLRPGVLTFICKPLSKLPQFLVR